MIELDTQTLNAFPLVVRPTGRVDAEVLTQWLSAEPARAGELTREYGAVLFRGFEIRGAASFEAVCRAGTPDLVEYTGGGSIRTHVEGKVYTSTEYAADQHIPLHCESTYFPVPPRFIWLLCEIPAAGGGETPIGDMQRVLGRLDPEVVARFRERGVRYIYNLHGGNGFGRGWREAFGTQDASAVESWLQAQGADYRWTGDGTLHIDLIGPALRTHDRTGAIVWGNQAANWHIASLPQRTVASLRRLYKDDERLPKHAVFGDGSAIPDEHIRHILETLMREETAFPWQRGDVLLCDNQRYAHGRRPFQGERRVLVALS
jgi:hypothetical protein